jgi:flagellar biosynthesis/type III secretory pathway chaperone
MSATLGERRVKLERIVEDSISEALALELALQAERNALETRDDAALGSAAKDKGIRVAKLEQLEADRRAAGMTFAPTQGLPGSSTNFPAADLLPVGRWQAFLSIVARCKRMNTTNGAIIHLRRQQVNDALRLVSGTGTGTYGPSGEESPSAGRALAAV